MAVEIVSHTEDVKQRHRAAVSDAIDEMGEAFLSFTRTRFASEGDGEWAPLAEATVEEREWLGFPGTNPILKRLGVLEGALTRGNDGNLFVHEETRVTVGISGGSHPGYDTPDGNTIYAGSIEGIAMKNQALGRIIFVSPDDAMLNQMQTILVNRTTLAIG